MSRKWGYLSVFPVIFLGIAMNFALSRLCSILAIPLFLDCYGTIMATLLGGYLPGIIVGFMTNLINGMRDPVSVYYAVLSVMIALAAGILGKRGCFDRLRRAALPVLVFTFLGGVLGSSITWLLYGGGIGSGISAPYALRLLAWGWPEFSAQLFADVCIDLADKVVAVLLVVCTIKLIPDRVFKMAPYALVKRSPQRILTEKHRDYRVRSLRTKVIMILVLNSLVLSGVAIAIGNYLYRPAIAEKYADPITGLVERELLATDLMVFNIKLVALLFGAAILIVMAVLVYCDTKIVAPINAMTRITEDLAFDDPKKKALGSQLLLETHIQTGDEIENLFQALTKMSRDTEEYVLRIKEDARYIARMQEGIIASFADMVENRDENTGDHIRRTSAYVGIIARTLQEERKKQEVLTEQYIWELMRSAPLHDVGKIKIADAVLLKPGKLTPEEFVIMKTHTTAGGEILEQIAKNIGKVDCLSLAAEMAVYHHEWWNGAGYPAHLSGEEIPLSARIMAIADVFDALVSKRSYKEAMSFEAAVKIIAEEAGTHFDPEVTQAFLDSKDKIRDINERFTS